MAAHVMERLKAKVRKEGDCLVWTGCKNWGGYGLIKHNGKMRLVHRVAFEAARGEIPNGLQLDHLCRNRACCNSEHLEPVTNAENSKRGLTGNHMVWKRFRSHCRHGHEFTPENTYIHPRGHRECRQCKTDGMRKFYERKRDGQTR